MNQPFPSWSYNGEIGDWEAPDPLPTLTDDQKANRMMYRWIEGTGWELVEVPSNIPYPY